MDELGQIQSSTTRYEDILASNPDTKLHPFDPERDKPVKLPNGYEATEYTRTYRDPGSGAFVVIPTIWYTDDGNAVFVGDRAVQLMQTFESDTGSAWPRFSSIREADAYARDRSNRGGGNAPRGENK